MPNAKFKKQWVRSVTPFKQGQKPDVNTCLIESNLVNQCNKAFKNSPPRSLCKTLGKPNNRKTSLNRALAAVVAVLSGTGIARK